MSIRFKGGPWTNAQDQVLLTGLAQYGLQAWEKVASLLPDKKATQCRERWEYYLDPRLHLEDVPWGVDEDEALAQLAAIFPSQWRLIAEQLTARTSTHHHRPPWLCEQRYNEMKDEMVYYQQQQEQQQGGEGGEQKRVKTLEEFLAERRRRRQTYQSHEERAARADVQHADLSEQQMIELAVSRLANQDRKKSMRKTRQKQLEEANFLARLENNREAIEAGTLSERQAKRTRQALAEDTRHDTLNRLQEEEEILYDDEGREEEGQGRRGGRRQKFEAIDMRADQEQAHIEAKDRKLVVDLQQKGGKNKHSEGEEAMGGGQIDFAQLAYLADASADSKKLQQQQQQLPSLLTHQEKHKKKASTLTWDTMLGTDTVDIDNLFDALPDLEAQPETKKQQQQQQTTLAQNTNNNNNNNSNIVNEDAAVVEILNDVYGSSTNFTSTSAQPAYHFHTKEHDNTQDGITIKATTAAKPELKMEATPPPLSATTTTTTFTAPPISSFLETSADTQAHYLELARRKVCVETEKLSLLNNNNNSSNNNNNFAKSISSFLSTVPPTSTSFINSSTAADTPRPLPSAVESLLSQAEVQFVQTSLEEAATFLHEQSQTKKPSFAQDPEEENTQKKKEEEEENTQKKKEEEEEKALRHRSGSVGVDAALSHLEKKVKQMVQETINDGQLRPLYEQLEKKVVLSFFDSKEDFLLRDFVSLIRGKMKTASNANQKEEFGLLLEYIVNYWNARLHQKQQELQFLQSLRQREAQHMTAAMEAAHRQLQRRQEEERALQVRYKAHVLAQDQTGSKK